MAHSVNREKIRFQNADGHTLAALLERPEGAPKACAVFAHCFTCSKNIAAATWISRALAERGFAVLRFDFTGLGNSDGDFSNTNFSTNVQDLVSAAEHMKQTLGGVELLIGHSFGGAAVIAAAGDISDCKAVVTIGAPADPAHIAHLFASHRDRIDTEGEAEVCLAGRNFNIKRQFLDDVEDQSQQRRIAELRKALLVMHAPLDEYVDVDNASRIFTAAKHPKSFVTLDEADHLLSDPRDAEYAAGVIAAWATRYVIAGGQSADADERPSPARGEVIVRERDRRLTNDIYTTDHHLIADEPASAGGDNLGPDPYQYLLSALGACTSMTVRMYANHKQLPLDSVTVHLQHEKIYADDCEGCDETPRKLDRLSRTISLKGDLDPSQRQRLLEIADRCPVHKTLSSEIRILSELAHEAD